MRETHERPVCHRAEDLVSYLYGEASPGEALDFRDHLQRCDACRGEFALFNQVHDSIQVWRSEALGASFNPAAVAAEPAIDSTQFVRHRRKLSALAALREFFTVSPLWLRGATAFAALLLCVLGVIMVVSMERKPAKLAQTSAPERLYTQQELETEVRKAVEQKDRELRANRENSSPDSSTLKPESTAQPNRMRVAVNHQPKNHQPGLNRQEREQLAADLRLTFPADEEELPFALPEQEHPNQ